MQFDISGFMHSGIVRSRNQDRIMVQDEILLDGICDFEQTETCRGFVAGWHRGTSSRGNRCAIYP
jgi:hypothetical protein